MLHTVPKWLVTISSGGVVIAKFYTSDFHLSNVVRRVADLDFSVGPDRPQADHVTIALVVN